MTLDLAALRTLAWQTFDCDSCGELVGHRCLTSSSARTTPHAARLTLARGWDARQAEVDGLQQAIDQRDSDISAANDALRRITTERDDLRTEVRFLNSENTGLLEQAAMLTRDVAVTKAEFAAYVKAHPDTPAEPTSQRFGLSLAPGVSATYGGLPVSKVFYPGALPAAFNAKSEGQVVGKHVYVCFKSFTVANLASYCASIPDGWTITLIYFQEPDDEMWVDKSMTVADYTAKTQQVLDTVKASAAGKDGRARVGQCFMEYSLTSGRWSDAVVVKGIDCLAWDFYSNTSAADPSKRIAAMAAVSKRLGVPEWAVLEIGDRPTTFKDGAARAAYWRAAFGQMFDLGASDLCWFNAIGTTGDHRVIPGQPYSDPMVALFKSLVANA